MHPPKDSDFDVSFYNNVSCNIRENLLHHLDGKLAQPSEGKAHFCHLEQHASGNQLESSADISHTAATPGSGGKSPPSKDSDNSSEYAQKPGRAGKSHPRRAPFEKYNFPRKYDGREQWSGCSSIQDLSKFDITTQLALMKKRDAMKSQVPEDVEEAKESVFGEEFNKFLRLRRSAKSEGGGTGDEEVLAELTGEWSKPRVYICGVCTVRYVSVGSNCLPKLHKSPDEVRVIVEK